METSVDHADADQAAPSRTEVVAHLSRVLESREFRAARNRARFLEYVMTRALDGEEQSLKEYTIGVEVFDRGASFDPRTDGVVRTQAGLVRKHLERYYATEGQDDRLEIVLPKGHYVPHVQRRTASAASAAAQPLAHDGERDGDHDSDAHTPGRGLWRPAAALAAIVVGVSVVTAIAMAGGFVRFSRGTDGPAAAAAGTTSPTIGGTGGANGGAPIDHSKSPIWGAFVAPGATTVLAFGIPQFFTLPDGGVWVRDVTVNSAPTAPDATADAHLEALRRKFGAIRPAEAYTGIGEAYGVFLLSRFFLGRSHDLRVVRSPTLSWDHLKHDNVIFLTSARFKTLADQLSHSPEFVHVLGAPNRVVKVHPAPGEQAEYVSGTTGTSMVDHAIISIWPGKRAGRRVLVLSGGHTWGTQAAAEYVTDADYLRDLESHLLACQRSHGLARHPDFFQVLLRVEIRDDQPVSVRYVAHHDVAITETGDPTDPQRAALTPPPR